MKYENAKMALSLELSGIVHNPKKVNQQSSWRLTFEEKLKADFRSVPYTA